MRAPPQVAEAVLEFADDLRTACAASGAWAETGLARHRTEAESDEDGLKRRRPHRNPR